MDLNNKTIAELSQMEEAIKHKKKEIHDAKVAKEREENGKRLALLREHKDAILSLIDHDRTSCSDDRPDNGYISSYQRSWCRKCHLIEILNEEWDNEFEVSLDVTITKIE